jgi:hypothetical protein
MKTNSSRFIALAAFAACLAIPLSAETKGSADLPIRRVVLFSSGVGYFEHAGSVEGNAVATLPFKLEEINDALKSLIVIDPKSSSPSVTYPSEDTLLRTLQSLRVDLSGAGDIASILGSLRGAEVTVFAPEAVNGRILGVEARSVGPEGETALFLSLMTKEGIRSLAMSEISTYAFADARIARPDRALDLLLARHRATGSVVTCRLTSRVMDQGPSRSVTSSPPRLEGFVSRSTSAGRAVPSGLGYRGQRERH